MVGGGTSRVPHLQYVLIVIVTSVCSTVLLTIMLTRTGGTKQRSDDRTTNLSRLIMIGNLRIDLFVRLWCAVKIYGSKPGKS